MSDLPRELIYAIVDAIVSPLDLSADPWIVDNASEYLTTLRACSLVAHDFVRPCQHYIFHGVTIGEDASRLATIVNQSPHIAGYIKALYIESALKDGNGVLVRQLLTLTTGLERLDIYPVPNGARWAAEYMAVFGDLALDSLHHLTLWYFTFDNATQLENLLSKNSGLRTLVLRSVTLMDTSISQTNGETEPLVTLERLDLYFLDAANVAALVGAFQRVDLGKLKSLYLHNTPMSSLIELNTSTLEDLRIRAYFPDTFLNQSVDADALVDASQLQTLDLKIPFLSSLTQMVRRFGPLTNLVQLHTIVLSVSQKTTPAEWTALDQLLGVVAGDLPGLKHVRVYSGSQWNSQEPHPEGQIRQWMPVLAARGVLRLMGHDTTEGDEFAGI
ncbi:hypothetical protein MIND_00121600 [Mycena indigotica]|uniref:Uncharacterized protein n=1 Tax=Mycena indigotica TaxID=2126181 RepID=A0A8H6TEZ6_9AGAR|nr:uncharacterized protein MIND_00121600 [Mycena indigotica]KAF7316039.1 hypothetical protein MIND_00121600 [Mycena indigotica]